MGSGRQSAVTGLLVLVAGMAGIGLGGIDRNPPVVKAGSGETTVADTFDVHVSGWVVRPGVVTVDGGAITAHAIELAGGFRPGARVETVNLAAEVFPGEQIVVPGPDSADQSTDDGVVSLNLASRSDLESLPGVGPVLAERIINHRETNGRFESVEDLLEVPGIGEAKLAALRDHIRP